MGVAFSGSPTVTLRQEWLVDPETSKVLNSRRLRRRRSSTPADFDPSLRRLSQSFARPEDLSRSAADLLGNARTHRRAVKDALALHHGVSFSYTPDPRNLLHYGRWCARRRLASQTRWLWCRD